MSIGGLTFCASLAFWVKPELIHPGGGLNPKISHLNNPVSKSPKRRGNAIKRSTVMLWMYAQGGYHCPMTPHKVGQIPVEGSVLHSGWDLTSARSNCLQRPGWPKRRRAPVSDSALLRSPRQNIVLARQPMGRMSGDLCFCGHSNEGLW